jgi:hypothetical protein
MSIKQDFGRLAKSYVPLINIRGAMPIDTIMPHWSKKLIELVKFFVFLLTKQFLWALAN